MQNEQHRGKSLTYLTIYPDEYDTEQTYPLVIMLHGYGVNMHDLAGLTPMIDTTGYLYVCPNAPFPLNVGQGTVGWAWTPPGGDASPEDVQRTERRLDTFYREVMEEYRVAPGRALLLGFSQGGSMTYRTGLSRPDLFAGLVALSGGLPDPDDIRGRLPAQRTQPIFIAHGLQDNIESARRSREFLEAEGYTPTYHEYDMGHEINQEVLDDLIAWMHQALPPLR